MFISNDTIDRIKDNINIVDVISEYVDLKPSGKNYKGLCPFHNEKTPSFMVNSEKGIFHCFGCGAGGNVFTFLMKLKGISFTDAVRTLAQKAGIRINEEVRVPGYNDGRDALYKVNKIAADFYKKLLLSKEGKIALDYLKKRKLLDESIIKFRVGYAPAGWDNLIKYMNSNNIKSNVLEKIGLVVRKKNGTGYYDRFRNRITFPIQDTIGRIVGFGGRTLEKKNDIPKYLNTSDNNLFHKGKSLYGFYIAEEYIKKSGLVFIVEGYLDVITMFQSGIMNVVAPLGTALTKEHADFITRYTKKIYLAFDPDEAGQKATIRTISIFHSIGVDPFIIRFPIGVDPADFFTQYRIEDFKLLVNDSLTGNKFLVKFYTKDKKNFTAQEKLSMLETFSNFYKEINDIILKDEFLDDISRELKLTKSVVKHESEKFLEKKSNRYILQDNSNHKMTAQKRMIKKELYLLLLLLNNVEYFDLAYTRIDSSQFKGKWTKRLWDIMADLYEKNNLGISSTFNLINSASFVDYISGKLMDEALYVNPKGQIIDLISFLKEKALKEKLGSLNNKIKKAELENSDDLIDKLITEKQMYRNELEKLKLLRSSKSII